MIQTDRYPLKLADRRPRLDPARIVATLVPPSHFAAVSLDNYFPDPRYPSQAAAVAAAREFSMLVGAEAETGSRLRRRQQWRRGGARDGGVRSGGAREGTGKARPVGSVNLYLDGGFGVGKTHLLAALATAAPAGAAVFGTFVEYTNLVGAIGFERAVETLSSYRLVCIDEFELDDPGDTVLISSLLARLGDSGVRLAATSNTLPGRLGEGRFNSDDFKREIQGLAARFECVRIEGDDYRHRGTPVAPTPLSRERVLAGGERPGSSLDVFGELLELLIQVHPSAYGQLFAGVDRVCLLDVAQLSDQAQALRLVVLVDRMYDNDVPVYASGLPLDQIFGPEMLAGGYRKKYLRAISRLVALARMGLAEAAKV